MPPPPAGPTAATEPDYFLGVGDEISVKVWRNDDLTRLVRIDPSGNVDLPLVGSVHAEGLTPAAFKQELTRRLAEKYLVNPQVDVAIQDVRSRKVFVLGEVRTPGALSLDRKTSPWEAIAGAGGFTHDANRGKVLLVRNEDQEARVAILDFDRALNGGNRAQVSSLRDRDLIYVFPRRIAELERFMQRVNNIIAPIIGLESATILGQDVIDVFAGNRTSTSVVVPR